MEAIKVLPGLGQLVPSRILTYDLRNVTFNRVLIERDPDCTV